MVGAKIIRFFRITLLPFYFSICAAASAQPALETLTLESLSLRNNPLRDPSTRLVEVFLPTQAREGRPLPIVYYLPGFGFSAASFSKGSNAWLKFTQKVSDEITPMIIVVIDGHNRWGGSQYINSAAQGNYADFVCDEIVSAVEARHPVPRDGVRRIISGHSSGGFGALRLGMMRKNLFDGVVALSPDSDFPTSHLPLVRESQVAHVPLGEIKQIANGRALAPTNGSLNYILALSAAYAPCGWFHRGQFNWPYDGRGHFREEVWQRWLDNDPLTLVEKHRRAFSARQSVYLEGAAHDEYAANIGARKIFEALEGRPGRRTFYEPPGHHSDHREERLERGLAWVFEKPVKDIH